MILHLLNAVSHNYFELCPLGFPLQSVTSFHWPWVIHYFGLIRHHLSLPYVSACLVLVLARDDTGLLRLSLPAWIWTHPS